VAAQTALESQQQLLPALKQLLASYCVADSSSRAQGSTALQPVDTTDVNNPHSGAHPAQRRTLCAHQPGPTADAKQQQQVLVPTLPGCPVTHMAWHSSRPRSLYEEVCYQNDSTTCSSASSPTNNSSRGHGTSSSSSSAADPTSGQFDPLSAALIALQQNPRAQQLTPSATVQQLDNHIVGQAVSSFRPGKPTNVAGLQAVRHPTHLLMAIVPSCCQQPLAACSNKDFINATSKRAKAAR